MSPDTLAALREILTDVREFAASDDGTDKFPDRQYLMETIEERLDQILTTSEGP